MKKILLPIFILVFNLALLGQDYNLMTYNLRYDNVNDADNSWPNRKEFIQSQIEYYEPDIIGTQEGMIHQIKWLDDNLTNYGYEGIGRDEDRGNGSGEFSAIFYNQKKIKVVEANTFWLSETPEFISKGWDASQNRICTYVLFEDLNNKRKFWVFNTHLDHKGDLAREKSVELILTYIKNVNKNLYPFIFMGDFNLTPEQLPILKICEEMNDSRSASLSKPFGPEETFSDFQVCQIPLKRIDFIFTSRNNIIVNKYATLVDVLNLHYPSDHYPVLINISLKSNGALNEN